MKAEKQKKKVYGKLTRKLLQRSFAITLLAVVSALLLRLLTLGRVADGLVAWLQRVLSIGYDEAWRIYFYRIRSNLAFFMAVLILGFMFVFFGMLVRSYKRCFESIVAAIEGLMEGAAPVKLPGELDIVEQTLNNVKEKLHRRETQLRQEEQQKNDLIVYLAHDIKTPLTSVIAYLSLLDEQTDLTEEQRGKYIHIAWEKAHRLETLAGEFFDLTRYSLQSVPLHKTKLNLCYLMVQLSDELYPQLSCAGKRIENLIAEDVYVEADAEKLARVFHNLLKNAIAYGEEGTITLNARTVHETVLVDVMNPGVIPERELALIFDKFYRSDTARTSATGGAGLGLAIARDIVKLHGGTLSVRSERGQTVFTVELKQADKKENGEFH